MSSAPESITITGKVSRGETGKGSKSEHNALYIQCKQGSFVLRKKGGNPFNDSSMNEFEGKTVIATGIIRDYVFIATEVREEAEK